MKDCLSEVPMMGFEPIPRFSRERILSPLRLPFRHIGFYDNKGNSFVLNLAAEFRCQHAAKTVDHITIVAIDYVPIGGLRL